MNPRSRKAALYAIGAIAILASANALAHSYAGLYEWALHHRLSGWQAMSWPAEIDVFLAVGELALYVAYLDGWATRQRVWPWATALTGLAVSVAGNIGHIQAGPGQAVLLSDRLTAAASPVAAFAGLAIGLLVLKMTRRHAATSASTPNAPQALVLTMRRPTADPAGQTQAAQGADATTHLPGGVYAASDGQHLDLDPQLVMVARSLCQEAAARGERLSQRGLARQLRRRGHRFPNGHLRRLADSIGLNTPAAA